MERKALINSIVGVDAKKRRSAYGAARVLDNIQSVLGDWVPANKAGPEEWKAHHNAARP